MNKSVIVYGPQGCGKTTNAEALRKHFGLTTIVDGEYLPEPTDHLFLINVKPVLAYSFKVISFEDAMKEMQQ